MASQLLFFMAPEDEVAFFRMLERFRLEVYPRRVPPDWTPFFASEQTTPQLPEEELYLTDPAIGDVIVDKIKRGPDKGFWRVDEVRSPVIFMERSRRNEDDELLNGQLWAELDATPQTGRRSVAPDRLRRLYGELEGWIKKSFRRSDPPGYFIGPHAARAHKEGLVLRENEHRGRTVEIWR
ncbi:MAG: hypothetical protein IRZ16_17775 [Myxococcaceae bacterium]|nr:hypothetical protein [Myxococcaceae bacterium]